MKKLILTVLVLFFSIFNFYNALAVGYSNAKCKVEREPQANFICCPSSESYLPPHVWVFAPGIGHTLPTCADTTDYYTQCDDSTPAVLTTVTTLPAYCTNTKIVYESGTPVAPTTSKQ